MKIIGRIDKSISILEATMTKLESLNNPSTTILLILIWWLICLELKVFIGLFPHFAFAFSAFTLYRNKKSPKIQEMTVERRLSILSDFSIKIKSTNEIVKKAILKAKLDKKHQQKLINSFIISFPIWCLIVYIIPVCWIFLIIGTIVIFLTNGDLIIAINDVSHLITTPKNITRAVPKYFSGDYKDNISHENESTKYNEHAIIEGDNENKEYNIIVCENQRWWLFIGWIPSVKHDMPPWSDENGNVSGDIYTFSLDNQADTKWVDNEWTIVCNLDDVQKTLKDSDIYDVGWSYGTTFWTGFRTKEFTGAVTRRRKWRRKSIRNKV